MQDRRSVGNCWDEADSCGVDEVRLDADTWNRVDPRSQAEPWIEEDPWIDNDPWLDGDLGETLSIENLSRLGIHVA